MEPNDADLQQVANAMLAEFEPYIEAMSAFEKLARPNVAGHPELQRACQEAADEIQLFWEMGRINAQQAADELNKLTLRACQAKGCC